MSSLSYPTKELISTPIMDDKNILDLLTYKGICYWWPISWKIYSQLESPNFLHQSKIKWAIYRIDVHIPLMQIYYLIHKITHINTNKYIYNQKCKKIIVFGIGHTRVVCCDGGKSYIKDISHDDILAELKKINPETDGYHLVNIMIGDKKIKLLKSNPDFNILPESRYHSLYSWCSKAKAHRHFKTIYRLLDASNWFQQWAEKTNTSIPHIKALFYDSLVYYLPLLVEYSQIMNKICKIEQPSAFMLSGEQSSMGRLLTIISHLNHIPILALQHGVNYDTSRDYTYHSKTSSIYSPDNTDFIIPTVTSVYGEYDYNLLMNQGHYQNGSVKICGNQRYDNIVNNAAELAQIILTKYPQLNNKKIILWATQTNSNKYSDNIDYLNDVVDAVNRIPNSLLIIKQHPAERDEDTNLIQNKLMNSKINFIFLDKTDNITPYIYLCDLLVHHGSTCGQEAIIFNKPMLILAYSSQIINGNYSEANLGAIVRHSKNLEGLISDILTNPKKYINQYDSYVEKHLYKIDNKSAERIARVLYDLII